MTQNPTPDPMPPFAPGACEDAARRLRALEREAAGGGLEPVARHVRACPACSRALGARLSRVEAREALRDREAPPGLFDGFYDGVQSRLALAPPGGGLSPAFLDAPRALRVWRATALAAMVVVGLGAGYLLQGDGAAPGGLRTGEHRLESLPAGLQPPMWSRGGGTYVRAPAESPERYFDLGEPVREGGSREDRWD